MSYTEAIQKGMMVVERFYDNNPQFKNDEIQVNPVLPAYQGVSSSSVVKNPAGLIKTVSEIADRDIYLSRMPTIKIAAMMILDDDDAPRANIVYSKELNVCWSRFLICKELSHILLSNKNNKTSSKEELTDLLTGLGSGMMHTPQLEVESVAHLSAIEMLMPQSAIDVIKRDYIEAGAGLDQVAKSYKVPLKVVQLRFTQSISGFFDEAYSSQET